jgi:hypothetical protein
MRSLVSIISLLICVSFSLQAQVPSPQTPSVASGPLTWNKTGESTYTLRGANGNVLPNVQKLNRLKTDTLSYLDKDSRTIYLLPDCVDAAQGTSGKMSILERNIGNDFYITNQKSFVTYIDDKSYLGDFVNVNGSYIYYLEEFDKTYYHKDIRNYSGWAARNIETMAYAPENTYWYRNAEKKSYGVIVKGQSIDYDIATTEKDGNDLIVKLNGTPKYRLKGYYTMASFVFNPVEMYTGSSTSSTATTGCIKGDCDNGWGKWQYEAGYYDGFWENGKRHGYGLYRWDGVGKYIGNWENDSMNGYGAYIADNNDNVVGEYRNGKLNGRGYTVVGKEWSQGWYTNGELTDSYDYVRNDSDIGCTTGDCQNKYGYFKWENGDHFVGFFKNGKIYLGSYTFANGDKYSGMFNDQQQYHGTGRFFFEAGGYYGGDWKNGKYHGKGYYHDKDLVQSIGEWSDGVLVKKL